MAWGAIAGAAISTIGGAMLSDGGGGGQASASQQQADQARTLEAQISQEQWDRYKSLYGPAEEEYLNESKNLGSQASQNKAAQQAAADVAGEFSRAREQLANQPGVDPGSQEALQEKNRLNLAEAATSAAAQTGARQNVQQQGRAAITDALSLGKGLPAQAMTGLAQAGQGLQGSAQYWQGRGDATAAGFGKLAAGITNTQAFKNFVGGYTPGGSNSSNQPDNIDAGGGWNPAGGSTSPSAEELNFAGAGAYG